MQRIAIALLLVLLLNLTGCGSGPSVSPTSSATPDATAPNAAAPAAVTPPAALTEAEMKDVESFAKKIEASVNKNDPSVMDTHFDYAAMELQSSKDLQLKPEFLKGFMSGFRKTSLAVTICHAVKNNGNYKLLRVRQVNGVPHAIFRCTVEGAANYHDFYLKSGGNGDYNITDLYIYMTGETMTTTLRRAMLQYALEQNKGLLDRLTGTENEYVKNMGNIVEIQHLTTAGKLKEALALYWTLPTSVQREKIVMMSRLTITQQLSKEDNSASYRATLDDFQKFFPNDPGLDLMLIDGFFLQKAFDKAVACVDRVDQALGGDGYMGFLRTTLYHEMKQYDKMRKAGEQAIAMEPEFEMTYFILLQASTEEKNYADTVKTLIALEKQTKKDYPQMEKQPMFADFIKSKEYREWRLSRKANQAEQKQHN